ncbi:MAG: OPT/YSL family transporter [Acidobacteriota bacterium]|nr:OPT/YSL family transporter [Acidobacteriota bacterium]
MSPLRFLICLTAGFFLGLSNLYIGLRLGFVYGVAILAAFTWTGLKLILPRVAGDNGWVETALFLSMASAMSFGCGTVISTSLSAFIMSGAPLPPLYLLTLWVSAICGLGTCLALPLRRRLLAELKFPSGTVAATTVKNLDRGKPGMALFSWTLLVVWIWVALRDWLHLVQARFPAGSPVLHLQSSPMLLGLGSLLGPRICLGMLAGATCFFLAAPAVFGATASKSIPWFAVGLMISAGLLDFGRSLRGLAPAEESRPVSRRHLPVTLSFAAVLCLLHAIIFDFSWIYLLLAAVVVWPFAVVACRVTGETDVVPTGALGKLSLLIFSMVRPAEVGAMTAATGVLTGASASSADFLNDLRCGRDLGCPPARQFRYQLAGAVLGPLIFVPLLFYLIRDNPLGGEVFPAPAAQIWLEIAKVLAGGEGAGFPIFALGLACGALVFTIRLRFPKMPGAVPFAMAAFLDWGTTATLALGALLARFIPAIRDDAFCCALIAAESAVVLLLLLN